MFYSVIYILLNFIFFLTVIGFSNVVKQLDNQIILLY
jgi:hypothetical protein